MKNEKYTEICGETMELHQDEKISLLNVELAVTKIGAPVIVLQDWTEKEKRKDLVVLHLKDAIKLKSVIDDLVTDATLFEREYVEELMEGKKDEE
jgi:hypothetical protein